jgi:hypothetical protein
LAKGFSSPDRRARRVDGRVLVGRQVERQLERRIELGRIVERRIVERRIVERRIELGVHVADVHDAVGLHQRQLQVHGRSEQRPVLLRPRRARLQWLERLHREVQVLRVT